MAERGAHEALAQQVEARVIAAAEAGQAMATSDTNAGTPGDAAEAAMQASAAAHANQATNANNGAQASNGAPAQPASGAAQAKEVDIWEGIPDEPDGTDANDPWGGLPAPWQPLPDWLTASTSVGTPQAPSWPTSWGDSGSATAGSGSAGAAPAGAVSGSGGTGSGGGAQFAPRDRSPEDVQVGPSTASHGQPAKVEPNLDVLAQQVYSILKKRISAERRRFG
jgi:hypothetical protein